MRRHDLDLTSLLAGIVFAAVAGAGLASDGLDLALDPLWLVPGVLVALGVAGLLGTWSRMRRDAAESRMRRDAAESRLRRDAAEGRARGPADDEPSDTTAADGDVAPDREDDLAEEARAEGDPDHHR